MTDPVKTRRRYDSPRRREAAAATRRTIVDSARRLFEEQGYTATPIAAIARDAGVSEATVYNSFGSKGELLRAVWHRALRGERDDTPVDEQPWYREVLDAPDAQEQLRLNARNSRRVKDRAGALIEAIAGAAAADADAAELWRRIEADFHANQRAIVESLAAKGALRPGLRVAEAADVMWTLNHPSVHRLLTGARGWSGERYERWLLESFRTHLLGDDRAPH